MHELMTEWIQGIPMSCRPPRWKEAEPVIVRCPYCGCKHSTLYMNASCAECHRLEARLSRRRQG